METLANETIQNILLLTITHPSDIKTLCMFNQTCKRFYDLSSDDYLWRKIIHYCLRYSKIQLNEYRLFKEYFIDLYLKQNCVMILKQFPLLTIDDKLVKVKQSLNTVLFTIKGPSDIKIYGLCQLLTKGPYYIKVCNNKINVNAEEQFTMDTKNQNVTYI